MHADAVLINIILKKLLLNYLHYRSLQNTVRPEEKNAQEYYGMLSFIQSRPFSVSFYVCKEQKFLLTT